MEDGTIQQIEDAIKMYPAELSGIKPFFSFMVDDMLFFRKFHLGNSIKELDAEQKAYSLHIKLFPGICYSHTSDKLIHLPKFEPCSEEVENLDIAKGTLEHLRYRRSETQLDWNYPFDFCGSIYRRDHILEVLKGIEEPDKILKPNTFEFIGNSTIKKKLLTRHHPYSLCLNQPVMTVITVNKV